MNTIVIVAVVIAVAVCLLAQFWGDDEWRIGGDGEYETPLWKGRR